jgi:hypothetical protein
MTDQPSPPAAIALTPQQVTAMLHAPVPRIFANGLAVQGTATDITLVFLDNGRPAGNLTVAYPVAKAIAVELTKVLTLFETKTGEKIKDINELSALLSK